MKAAHTMAWCLLDNCSGSFIRFGACESLYLFLYFCDKTLFFPGYGGLRFKGVDLRYSGDSSMICSLNMWDFVKIAIPLCVP